VARWSREGDVVTIEARTPVRGGFVVDVEGRRPLPTADVPLPAPTPLDVRRVERWWTLGRADEGELLPESYPERVAARALPEWARGLSDTPPLASWHGAAPVVLRAARYEAVMGPDTVVEDARFVLATNPDGRVLLRGTWRVRNERSQYLHVVAPPGWRPLTARVTGDPVSVLADGAGGVYVPLEKSIETLRGLLAFPVEVTWVAEGPAWARRGERRFELPAVDAPIQQATWEVHLPRGFEAVRHRGDREVPMAPPVSGADIADAALSNATRAYQENDFEAAQGWVDAAKEARPDDQNVDRLQSNLDVLLDTKDTEGGEDVGVRRVRDLANAKTIDAQNEQAVAEEKADAALRAGDEAAALDYLGKAEQLSASIAVTEQRESADQDDKAVAYKQKSDFARATLAKKRNGSSAAPSSSTSTGRIEPIAGLAATTPPSGHAGVKAPMAPTTADVPADADTTEVPVVEPAQIDLPAARKPAPERPGLTVRASPLTPALPLGTPALTHEQALLAAGEFPTFTVLYRPTPGATR
jgi:hypothetical protein